MGCRPEIRRRLEQHQGVGGSRLYRRITDEGCIRQRSALQAACTSGTVSVAVAFLSRASNKKPISSRSALRSCTFPRVCGSMACISTRIGTARSPLFNFNVDQQLRWHRRVVPQGRHQADLDPAWRNGALVVRVASMRTMFLGLARNICRSKTSTAPRNDVLYGISNGELSRAHDRRTVGACSPCRRSTRRRCMSSPAGSISSFSWITLVRLPMAA